MIVLRRTDFDRNMHRFYALGIMPTLFGEWTVVAEWGRIGAPGRLQRSTYADEVSAMKALARRLADKTRRGYCSTARSLVRCSSVGDVARCEWSDGNITSSPSRATAPDRRRAPPPTGQQGFEWATLES
jgi:predicted DNA-binding WGR domain protein